MKRLFILILLLTSMGSFAQKKLVLKVPAVASGGGGASTTPTITTASTSQTLSTDYETWVFTGSSAATFTLPAISGDTGRRYFIKNRGTANLTLSRAGSDQLYNTSLVTSITILPGGSFLVQHDGTYWVVLD